MKNTSLLARLFGRTQSAVVTQLFTHAIGQPLLVHPQLGEQILGGYLHGAVDARPPTLAIGELAPESRSATGEVTAARRVAVLNVSGALVNRYEGDFCDPGPLSYQELRQSFDSALADSTVEAIVLRLESPGGMGAGLFDLCDHIHASRGTKPIYASVDDYAYSACYALAAAADEIWTTRTGGVGSIGVIAYHYDQSAYDAKIGLKVTAIYSGEHKNDFSPHAALSDTTRAWLQERMDSMRGMFAGAVAKYRGLELDAVLATEAQVFQGQGGIDAGLADKLGTFHDLMAHLAAPKEEPAAQVVEVPAAAPSAAVVIPAEANAVTPTLESTITAAGLKAELAAALLMAPRMTIEQVPARAEHARAVADLCHAAKLDSCAPLYVERGTDLETVRKELQSAVADSGPELVTTLPGTKSGVGVLNVQGIYDRRKAAVST